MNQITSTDKIKNKILIQEREKIIFNPKSRKNISKDEGKSIEMGILFVFRGNLTRKFSLIHRTLHLFLLWPVNSTSIIEKIKFQ